MNQQPLYIFDLDGTLALNGHRQHLLDDLTDPIRWPKFFAACDKDEPNWPVIKTLLWLASMGAEIQVWSGRSDEVRHLTLAWMQQTGLMNYNPFVDAHFPISLTQFRMRKAGDFTPDEELKHGWLMELSDEDRARLVAVFDDRAKVVKMWRDCGVPCFQVAEGEF